MGPPASDKNNNNNDDEGDRTKRTPTGKSSSNNNVTVTRSLKKTTDSDFKSSVIEFMKARPFLWNKRHSGYKDYKKRDHEFMEFSTKIGYSVPEIKRVWHVLRTNFFRAHKMLSDKQSNGHNHIKTTSTTTTSANTSNSSTSQNGTEKVWKYYTAMLYILDSFNQTIATTITGAATSEMRADNDCDRSALNHTGRRVSNRLAASATTSSSSPSSSSVARDTNGLENGRALVATNGSSPQIAATDTNSNKTSTYNNESSLFMKEDDDFLYARSLSLTLRKFDPTTKEIVKLKFQEIIVDYMQKLQQQKQQQHQQHQQQQHNYEQSKQLSQLEPPPPSEIMKMEESLATGGETSATNHDDDDEVT